MIKQVIVARKDLNMRKGKLAAQVAHASVGTLTKFLEKNPVGGYLFFPPEPLKAWLEGKFTKIVVGCESEIELLQLRKKAVELNVIFALIQDSGQTEFHGVPTFTTIAIGPDEEEIIDKITGHLKLL